MPKKATSATAKQSASKNGARSGRSANKPFPKISINEIRPELPLPSIEAAVATETKSGIAFGVLVVCALALIAVFGASIMAGIMGVTGKSNDKILFESNESANSFDPAVIPYYDSFKKNYGDINNVKFFDVYSRSKASYGQSSFEDKCLVDVCSGNGCVNTPVESCSPEDKNCRLQEGFVVYPLQTPKTPRVANWLYPCPNGCSAGACIKTPACTDSDLSSDQTFPHASGNSNPFIKGVTRGYLDGVVTTTVDYCTTEGLLVEYYCNSGKVAKIAITCNNGCSDGACKTYTNEVSIGDIFKGNRGQPEVWFYGKDGKRHVFPNEAVYKTWRSKDGRADFSKLKIVNQDVINKLPIGEPVNIRPVGYIAKFTDDPYYYFVMTSNQLKRFDNEKTIAKFFGLDWKWRVIELAPSHKSKYRVLGSLIKANDKYPNGSIVRLDGYIGIFYIQSDKIRSFDNTETFLKNNLDLSFVVSAYSSSSIAYPEGATIKTVESRFSQPY